MFKEKELWKDVGYQIESGELELGKKVMLKRNQLSSPDFLVEKVPTSELIEFKKFTTFEEEMDCVAKEIYKNIHEDELDPKDIIVIHPNAIKTRDEVGMLRNLLYNMNIESHLAGVNTSPDDFFMPNSVAFTSIYRAKGNEAAMVYIINSDYCFERPNLIKKRNTLFTAITRSKGWVRLSGCGIKMEGLIKEFEKVKENNFTLNFRYPTEDEMKLLNVLHRDLTSEDIRVIKDSSEDARKLLTNLKNGLIQKEDLPKEVIDQLKNLLNEN